eukprot:scaffold7.g3543.t1
MRIAGRGQPLSRRRALGAGRAEEALLLCDFFGAERLARRCLDDDDDPQARERAAIVLLQALSECQRFDGARGFLAAAFGSLERSPPNVLLLWLALALDTEQRGEAQALVLRLMESLQEGRVEALPAWATAGGGGGASSPSAGAVSRPSSARPSPGDEPSFQRWAEAAEDAAEEVASPTDTSSSGLSSGSEGCGSGGGGAAPGGRAVWSRRQYLALLQLYVTEVLALEMRERGEVRRWLRDTQLPITEPEREALARELERAPAAGPLPTSAAAVASRDAEGAAGAPLVAGVRSRPQLPPLRLPLPRHQEGEAASASGSTVSPVLDWLGRGQLAVHQLFALLRGRARALVGAPVPAGSCSGASSGASRQAVSQQAVLSGVIGLVIAYSLYAERRAVARGLRRARRGVAGALADLAAMAGSLAVSPMAA